MLAVTFTCRFRIGPCIYATTVCRFEPCIYVTTVCRFEPCLFATTVCRFEPCIYATTACRHMLKYKHRHTVLHIQGQTSTTTTIMIAKLA